MRPSRAESGPSLKGKLLLLLLEEEDEREQLLLPLLKTRPGTRRPEKVRKVLPSLSSSEQQQPEARSRYVVSSRMGPGGAL